MQFTIKNGTVTATSENKEEAKVLLALVTTNETEPEPKRKYVLRKNFVCATCPRAFKNKKGVDRHKSSCKGNVIPININ
jgi:thioredoxin reductase